MAESNAQELSFKIETTASSKQRAARDEIAELFEASPLQGEDLLFNLGLYTRSSLLVKFIVMSDLYRRFKGIPGLIVEFGTWWGQNLILLENLRAIYEPFNKQRHIIGFDTFEGYTPAGVRDADSDVWQTGSYSTGPDHVAYLLSLLQAHEKSNVLGHLSDRHRLVRGDVAETAPRWFAERPQSIVAFAYFDMGLYEPTKRAMEAIKPHLVPGSMLLLDELTWTEAPGEAIAFKEVFADTPVDIEKIELYPSKSVVTLR